jgi:hypothetical protein
LNFGGLGLTVPGTLPSRANEVIEQLIEYFEVATTARSRAALQQGFAANGRYGS